MALNDAAPSDWADWADWADWLSYRPSDFLMFSPRLYWRLFESVNEAFWPWPLGLLALGLAWLVWPRAPRVATFVLGLLWCGVAWAFLLVRWAPIHWVAEGFALAFALQGLWLAGGLGLATEVARSLRGKNRYPVSAAQTPGHTPRARAGRLLLGLALVLHPALALLAGRPAMQAEFVGLAPDATAIATLGLLGMLEPPRQRLARLWWRASFAVPAAWCLVSAATLATLGSGQALVLLAAVALTLGAARRSARLQAEASHAVSR